MDDVVHDMLLKGRIDVLPERLTYTDVYVSRSQQQRRLQEGSMVEDYRSIIRKHQAQELESLRLSIWSFVFVFGPCLAIVAMIFTGVHYLHPYLDALVRAFASVN